MFVRYDLRTTDADAAKAFYAATLDLALTTPAPGDGPAPLAVWPLHEQARARGAPSHWLGNIGVADVDATARRLLDLGSEPLGPVQRARDGSSFAVVRDPIGAVVAVRGGAPALDRSPIAWHQLHTKDVERAWALYAELFGWVRTDTVEMPELEGGHWMFAWKAGERSAGSIANTARWPGVHVHWLYYFPVTDLDATIVKVRAHGGNAQSPVVLPGGERIAPCEDPQGAAFGVLQPA